MRSLLIIAALALLAIPTASLAAGPIRGTAEGEAITGTAGDDRILARGGDDTVNALAGNDRVKGGRGEDTIDAGAGNDLVDGRGDGRAPDVITCGPGDDTVRASRNDEVAADCENVKQPGTNNGATAPPAGEEPPFDDDGKPGKGPKPKPAAA
jgi:Ca2+-binding RTX toxin-like protein